MTDKMSRLRRPCPSDSANIFSQVSYLWILPLFWKGYKKELSYDDLYACSKYDDSDMLDEKLSKEWQKEIKKGPKKSSLARAIRRAFGLRYLTNALFFGGIEYCIVSVIQPFLLGGLIDYFAGQVMDQTTISLYIGGFLLCSISVIFTHHPYFMSNARYGMRVRTAVQRLVLEKLFIVSKSALHNRKIGQIINLISNDVNKFDECAIFFPYLILVPIQAITISVLLWRMLSYSYLAGFSIILLFVPLQGFMGRLFGKVRRGTASYTDQRIRLMNEIVAGMKVIKMYSWEKSFAEMIADIRRLEIRKVMFSSFLRAVNLALGFVITRLVLFACLVAFISFGNQLTAQTVFVTSALVNTLKVTLTFFLPTAISTLSEALVSCDRLKEFLLLEEKTVQNIPEINDHSSSEDSKKSVEVVDLSAYWDVTTNESCLENVCMDVESGQLMTVVGPVGSGKSTLLQSLVQEVIVKFKRLKINGTISYAPQEAFTFNASIRENILIGQTYKHERYQQVLIASALDRDIKILPYGDQTLVGERGVGLSGGQRARVALARAIYHEADIYLLDDPLSAVDARVANQIFEKCCKGFLRSKVVILVTHHLHFLQKSDKILLLNHGQAKQFASYEELQRSGSDMMTILSMDKLESKQPRQEHDVQRSFSTKSCESNSESIDAENMQNGEPTVTQEVRKTGSVSGRVYWTYFRAGAGVLLGLVALFFNLASQILSSVSDLWLADWTNKASNPVMLLQDSESNSTSPLNGTSFEYDIPTNQSVHDDFGGNVYVNDKYNTLVYSGLTAGLFVSTLLRSTLFFYMCNRASINLHDSIFYRILRSPMSLFETNPVGLILNRFSRDLGTVDEMLPFTSYDLLMNFFIAIGVLTLVAIVSLYMLIPAFLLLIVVWIFRSVYIRTGRDLKRIESMARSPIYTHISTVIDGLTTIRVFKIEDIFRKQFASLLNDHSAIYFTLGCSSRSLGVWTDWACFSYILATTLVLIFFSEVIPAGSAGLALSQVLMLTGMFQWFVRQSAEFESQMTSVERIVEYTELPIEKVSIKKAPLNWPSKGSISFTNVYLQYSSCPKPSLVDINLHINPGEKIGIVGRTGAGKSSLLSCLFRLVEPRGVLRIDGIDIQSVSLHDLRRKISIIPQDSVIFAGTVRSNLDPFREHPDTELWDALEDVQLKEKIMELSGDLDHEIREKGDNFSVGQRQLICLARALLRNNKILVIDEATANVDLKTDQLIQQTIRSKFSHCTVLTIAHRLNTVIDSDRILVLDAGRAVEFDTPHALLQQKDSYLAKLVVKTGKSMSQKLFALAAQNNMES